MVHKYHNDPFLLNFAVNNNFEYLFWFLYLTEKHEIVINK